MEEELPPTTELEQALRNGVILCKLGHYTDPEALPMRRIYDLDESKYRVCALLVGVLLVGEEYMTWMNQSAGYVHSTSGCVTSG